MELKELIEKVRKTTDSELAKFLPKKISAKWIEKTFGKNDYDETALNEFLAKPAWDLLERGGKRWRPLLMLLSCGAVGGKPELIKKFAAVPELIHNGTLIADDVEDSSGMRRGKKAVHRIYGTDVAVNLSSMLYYLPLTLVKNSKLKNETKLEIYELINHELLNLHMGQGTDIHWHKKGGRASERKYLAMCANKTGTLARLSAKLGAILGNGEEEQVSGLGKFAERIGIAFQIQDDVLNLEGSVGKSYGDDITEGKMSLPAIKAMEKASRNDRKRLESTLRKHTTSREEIREAISIIKKYDGLSRSKDTARKIVEKAWNETERLLPASEYKKALKELAEFVTERKR